MSLLDDLTNRTDGRGHQECAVGYALRRLDEHTAEKFRTVLAMPKNVVQSSEIARAFTEAGVEVGADSIRRHRSGDCKSCGSA